jgi:NAD(P)-dependent dehydrogenase (short-subunit alcohol dehydrogenase family)
VATAGSEFQGQVVLVTGAARGQGRSHAVEFAAAGADLVLVDVCRDTSSGLRYPLGTSAELDETALAVRAFGRSALVIVADVREPKSMAEVIEGTAREYGALDVVVANAGISTFGPCLDLEEQVWRDVVDTNLSGVWFTILAALPLLWLSPSGGRVVVTSSLCGLRGCIQMAHYTAAKHGLVGMVEALCLWGADSGLRVNSVHPGAVDAPPGRLSSKLPIETKGRDFGRFFEPSLPISLLNPKEVSDAVLWLASTKCPLNGHALVVDGGASGR